MVPGNFLEILQEGSANVPVSERESKGHGSGAALESETQAPDIDTKMVEENYDEEEGEESAGNGKWWETMEAEEDEHLGTRRKVNESEDMGDGENESVEESDQDRDENEEFVQKVRDTSQDIFVDTAQKEHGKERQGQRSRRCTEDLIVRPLTAVRQPSTSMKTQTFSSLAQMPSTSSSSSSSSTSSSSSSSSLSLSSLSSDIKIEPSETLPSELLANSEESVYTSHSSNPQPVKSEVSTPTPSPPYAEVKTLLLRLQQHLANKTKFVKGNFPPLF